MEVSSEENEHSSSPEDDACNSPRMGGSSSGGRSTECAVCSEVTDNHHMHYGAMCCFSCRAFFRRANQKTKKTVYVCKQDGNCDISFKNRKKCQKCRYEKCLRVGMDPSLVLNDDQKRARFRKMHEKKPATSSACCNSNASSSASIVSVGSSSSGVASHDLKLHATDSRFGGQIRRSKTMESGSPLHHVAREAQRARKLSGQASVRCAIPNLIVASADSLEPPAMTKLGLNASPARYNEQPVEETIFSQAVAEEQSFKREMTEFEQFMAEATPMGLQNDSLADLEATLSLAAENSQLRFEACNTSDFVDLFSSTNTNSSTPLVSTLNASRRSPALFESLLMENNSESLQPLHSFTTPMGTSQVPSIEIQSQGQRSTSNSAPESYWSLGEYSGANNLKQEVVEGDSEELIKLLGGFNEVAAASSLDEDLTERIVAFHSTKTRIMLSDAKQLIQLTRQQFCQFASRQLPFQGLNRGDQENLLATNGALYLNYILGKYFITQDGSAQLKWLLGSNFAPAQYVQNLGHVDIVEFNACVNLFESDEKAQLYLETAEHGLKGLKASPSANGVIAALILYNTRPFESEIAKQDGMRELVDSDAVEAAFRAIKSWIRNSPNYAHILVDMEQERSPKFIDCLIHLKQIFQTRSNSCATPSSGKVPGHLEMPYTMEEEGWYSNQMMKYNQVYDDVQMGHDWITEFVMFSYDVPLSKHFVTNGYATFLERFKRILMVHDGFQDLSSKDQADVWSSGSAKAISLYAAKSECMQNGKDQLELLFGSRDAENWRQNFADNLAKSHNKKIRKISMVDCNRASSILNSEEMMDYMNLVVGLNELTMEPDVFKLLSLVALFCGDDMSPKAVQFAIDIRNQYMSIIRRRLNNSRSYDKLCVGLNEIDELSKIMRKLDISVNSSS